MYPSQEPSALARRVVTRCASAAGSLVCQESRPPHLKWQTARLAGWSRVWGHQIRTAHKGMTDLTVTPTPGTMITGVAITVRYC